MASSSWTFRGLFRLQKYIIALLFVSFICGMVLGISLVTNADLTGTLFNRKLESKSPSAPQDDKGKTSHLLNKLAAGIPLVDQQNNHGSFTHRPLLRVLIDKDNEDSLTTPSSHQEPSYNVHVFYYPWYGNPEVDGHYLHWDHPYLAHWDKKESARWPKGRHVPPDDIGSNYYPQLGAYSSRDPNVIDDHMQQIRSAGIGVLAVSWYPPGQADEQGKPWDDLLPQLLSTAHKYSLKICLHIEPYKTRSPQTLKENLAYIKSQYSSHPAFYKIHHRGRDQPLFYIYDSYLIKREQWADILRPDGAHTLRYTDLDAVFIGLLVEERHKVELVSSGFDGFYTYFASDGFSYGSSTRHWGAISGYAQGSGVLFIPSVGPGYIDERIRPWNARNTKDREHGGYYEQSFKAALAVRPQIISITSFNEWGEGTQIEKSIPKQYKNIKYKDFAPQAPAYYLSITKKWVQRFNKILANKL